MSYAVLWVKNFALHALRRSDPALVGKPLALVAGEGKKASLTEVSAEAREVEPGYAVTLAMARCPGIVLRTRDGDAEIEAQRVLLAAAFALSPRVESTGAGWCTIDLQGADEGRTEAEMRRQVTELTSMGIPAQGGMADTPLLASYAARAADSVQVVRDARVFLKDLPLVVAQPTSKQAEVLRGWGLKTLGDLTALAKPEVGSRLGPEGVALWERAAGETTRPLRLFEISKTFLAEWIYEPPIEMLEPLTFKLQRYCERVACELRAAGFVAEQLTLTLFLEDGLEHDREFRLPEPSADVTSWMRVLLSYLETVRLDSSLAKVKLVAAPSRPQQKQDGLFDTGLRDPSAFWENLARLGALVGDDRVGTPVLSETHRPDAFVLAKPADAVPSPEEPSPHSTKGLVLRRFRPGRAVMVEFAENKPVAVRGAIAGKLCAAHGPVRMSGDWWCSDAWEVETWQVELAGCVYLLATHGKEWSLEGVFD